MYQIANNEWNTGSLFNEKYSPLPSVMLAQDTYISIFDEE